MHRPHNVVDVITILRPIPTRIILPCKNNRSPPGATEHPQTKTTSLLHTLLPRDFLRSSLQTTMMHHVMILQVRQQYEHFRSVSKTAMSAYAQCVHLKCGALQGVYLVVFVWSAPF